MTRPYLIKEMAQLRVLTDPARWKILQALSRDPKTAKQVAEVLHEPPTRLYHHVKTLERAGLIRLITTRMKRGTTEKYYRAVAEDFIVDPRLFARGKGMTQSIRGSRVDMMRDALSAVSVDRGPAAAQVLRGATGAQPHGLNCESEQRQLAFVRCTGAFRLG